jgi:hypothetical protein
MPDFQTLSGFAGSVAEMVGPPLAQHAASPLP